MQTIRITTSQNIDIDYEVAGVGERIVARILDFVLFGVVLVLAIIIFSLTLKDTAGYQVLIIVLVSIYGALFVFYDLLFEVLMNGQSVGKRIMKIKVISLNGGRPSFGQYLMRWLFRIVDFTFTWQLCGLICVIVSDKKQRLGDIVAGTTLIKTEPRALINNLAFTPQADDYIPVFTEATQLNDNDIALMHEVITAYLQTGNTEVVYAAATRIKELLAVKPPAGMDSLQFLQTLVKDYSHINARVDAL
jgi:uncharacterized RDD family membrane protein YckC